MNIIRLVAFSVIMALGGQAAASAIYLTNTTPEPIQIDVHHYGSRTLTEGSQWQQFVTEIPPYATRKVLEFNRFWGVSRGHTYNFDTYVTQGNSTVVLQQSMTGTWTGSRIVHSARGDDFDAPWFNGWEINRFATDYAGNASLVGVKPHATLEYADFRYVVHNHTLPEQVSGTDELKVVTYNVEDLWVNASKRAARMAAIPSHMQGYDVILMQEAFSGLRDEMLLEFAAEYPYQTHIPSGNSWNLFDSGTVILSRYPISRVADFVYPDCTGTDCFADKSVVYAEVIKNGKAYHVTNTHAASFDTDSARAVRQIQFQQIRALVDEQDIPVWEPVMMGGDFNVNKLIFPDDHAQMLANLDATEPTNTGHGSTYDGSVNANIGSGKVQYLDYVVYSNTHLAPTASRNDVRVPRSANDDLWNWWDLSDHFPVMGEFSFAP